MGSCIFFYSMKPGRDNLCVINHKAVLRIQLIDNVFKYFMLNITGLFVQDHETGAGTVRQRVLGNPVLPVNHNKNLMFS